MMNSYIRKNINGSDSLHVVIGNQQVINIIIHLSDKYRVDPAQLIIEAVFDCYSNDIQDPERRSTDE